MDIVYYTYGSAAWWLSQGYTWGPVGIEGYLHSSQQLQYVAGGIGGPRTEPWLLEDPDCCW